MVKKNIDFVDEILSTNPHQLGLYKLVKSKSDKNL
jgi:hypothetical protein